MVRLEKVRTAADDLAAAALLGGGWQSALGRFAHAAGARHAVVMRNTLHRPIAAISNEEAADAIADYLAGKVPPNSRYQRVNLHRARGFRVDHDDYTDDMLARDPYYQEFLRRHGVFWHANVRITAGRDEFVELSLKRDTMAGPYQRGDAAMLDRVLPQLSAAARLAKVVLDAEIRGMAHLMRRHGGPVIEIDSDGRVMAGQAVETDASSPLRLSGRRLVTADPPAQRAVDKALAIATARPGSVALAPMQGPDGREYLLQVQPVPGVARDVFLSASAVAVLIERNRTPPASGFDRSAIRDAFGLTQREADVACLIAEGYDLVAIARHLGIRPDTARTYLKDVFEKTGAHRQAELVALFARVST